MPLAVTNASLPPCSALCLPWAGINVAHGHRSPPGGMAGGRMGCEEEDNVKVMSGGDGGPQAPLLP